MVILQMDPGGSGMTELLRTYIYKGIIREFRLAPYTFSTWPNVKNVILLLLSRYTEFMQQSL